MSEALTPTPDEIEAAKALSEELDNDPDYQAFIARQIQDAKNGNLPPGEDIEDFAAKHGIDLSGSQDTEAGNG